MLMLPFMDPLHMKRMMDDRAAYAIRNAQRFDEIVPPRRYGVDVGIVASSFLPENPMRMVFPEVGEPGIEFDGRLWYKMQRLPKGNGISITGSPDLWHDSGRAFFDDDVSIPVLLHKDHNSKWDVWMGLTPMELWSQRGGIRAATGRVVIGGLGMGWLTWEISKKPRVKEIVVVEKDGGLLDWYGRRLCGMIPKVTDVIQGDVFDVAPRFDMTNTRFVLDVWKEHGDASWDRRLSKLRETARYVWAWGGGRG